MSSNSPPVTRAIEVDQDYLPHPATKLIITQHLVFDSESDNPYWAWLIVGAFYDRQGNALWSTEIFWAHLDIELESDTDEGSDEESRGSSVPSDAEEDADADSDADSDEQSSTG